MLSSFIKDCIVILGIWQGVFTRKYIRHMIIIIIIIIIIILH